MKRPNTRLEMKNIIEKSNDSLNLLQNFGIFQGICGHCGKLIEKSRYCASILEKSRHCGRCGADIRRKLEICK